MSWFSSDCYGNSTNLFFFQAEDGIRDLIVTGVQTCALPISSAQGEQAAQRTLLLLLLGLHGLIRAAVEESGIPPRLGERLRALPGRGRDRGDGGGEGDGEHGHGGRTAPLPVRARCNLRAWLAHRSPPWTGRGAAAG